MTKGTRFVARGRVDCTNYRLWLTYEDGSSVELGFVDAQWSWDAEKIGQQRARKHEAGGTLHVEKV